MRKPLAEITRDEWVSFNWGEVPASFGDGDRIFEANQRRSPDEACQAAMDWDSTEEERELTRDVEL